MSEVLYDWIRTLIGAALICTVALTVCPKGRAKRVLSFACACVMALALLSPIASPDVEAFSRALGRYGQAADEVVGDAEADAEQYQRRVIERECEAYISDRADALGVTLSDVSVTLRWSEEGFWYPWECSVSCPDGRSQPLADAIESELGITPERQSWEAQQ